MKKISQHHSCKQTTYFQNVKHLVFVLSFYSEDSLETSRKRAKVLTLQLQDHMSDINVPSDGAGPRGHPVVGPHPHSEVIPGSSPMSFVCSLDIFFFQARKKYIFTISPRVKSVHQNITCCRPLVVMYRISLFRLSPAYATLNLNTKQVIDSSCAHERGGACSS